MPKFLIWIAAIAALIALPHGLGFSQQEILVFLTINVLLVASYRLLTLTFAIASGFAGISGALLAHYVGTINPNAFDIDLMVFVLTWAIVGGTATFYGPILGCVVLTVLNEIVLRELGLEQMRQLVYGAIMILSILFLPNGLESIVQKLTKRCAAESAPERSPAE